MSKSVTFTSNGFQDLASWIQDEEIKILRKIADLILNSTRDPFKGLGKPEPLKHYEEGSVWSRRIDKAHRLVYKVTNAEIVILQCRFHY